MSALEKFGQLPIMDQANLLSRSNLVPKAYRGKPADIVIALLWGDEVGLGPASSLSYIDVIEGNATINAEGSNALIRRAGHSLTVDVNNDRAIVKGKRSDTGDEMTVTWTMQMAKDAGLANKDVWKKYPQAMLTSRAVSQISRALFADVFLGISYSPEEAASFAAPELLDTHADALAAGHAPQVIEQPQLPERRALEGPQVIDVPDNRGALSEPKQRTFPAPGAQKNQDEFTAAEETLCTPAEFKALSKTIAEFKDDEQAMGEFAQGCTDNGIAPFGGKKQMPKDQYEKAMNLALNVAERQAEREAATSEPVDLFEQEDREAGVA